jgi:hypothetical protein
MEKQEKKSFSWVKNFYQPFKNLLRQSADTSQVDNQDGYINYGPNNDFPLRLAKMVEESPTGSACISTLADFIEGNGFSVEDVGKIIVNDQGETLADIHCKVSASFSQNEAFYVNVKYSQAGNKTQLYVLPFENCRLGMPDKKGKILKIHYNEYFGTASEKKQKTKQYDTYNPDPRVIQAQIRAEGDKYLGQVFYYGTTKALHRFYSEPGYFSASEWFEVDHQIGLYWKNNLENNFLQSIIFKLIGDPTAPSKDPAHQRKNSTTGEYESTKTVGEAWSEVMSEKFSGADKVGNIMNFWAGSKDEWPEVQAFPTDAKAEVFKVIEEMTAKKITVATGVPGILANISNGVNLGSDGAEIQAAVKLMQQRVVKKHHVLERTYTELLKNWKEAVPDKINIVHYDPYPEDVTVDDKIWNELTSEERRAWITKNTDIELIEQAQPAQSPNPAQAPAPEPEKPPTKPVPNNVFFNSYPEGARKNAKRALDHRSSSSVKCGSKFAWDLAERLAEGGPISYKEVKRIKNYLSKNEGFRNNKWTEGCEAVLYHSWGGKEMQDWCTSKIEEVG